MEKPFPPADSDCVFTQITLCYFPAIHKQEGKTGRVYPLKDSQNIITTRGGRFHNERYKHSH
ncbi:MAG: hypothetical protein HXS46_17530 [Theionarchaea archaeon]|nr:hypothetical protein [Theionarchaea archaeon]